MMSLHLISIEHHQDIHNKNATSEKLDTANAHYRHIIVTSSSQDLVNNAGNWMQIICKFDDGNYYNCSRVVLLLLYRRTKELTLCQFIFIT